MLCWKEIEYWPTVWGTFRPFETHSLTPANIELFVENLTPIRQVGTSDATKALKRWVLHNIFWTHKRIPFSIQVQLFYITWSMLILQIVASAHCVPEVVRTLSAILTPTENKTLGLKPMFGDNPFSYSPKVILAVPEQTMLISSFILHQTVRLFSRVGKQGCR